MMPTVMIVPAPPTTLLISVVEVTGIGVVSSTETEDLRDPHIPSSLSPWNFSEKIINALR
jgi:hypothetical protein